MAIVAAKVILIGEGGGVGVAKIYVMQWWFTIGEFFFAEHFVRKKYTRQICGIFADIRWLFTALVNLVKKN